MKTANLPKPIRLVK